jgi:hypothetical protein
MSIETFAGWTDEALIEYFRDWAIKQSQCGFNAAKHNRIDQENLVPSCNVLASRGTPSLRKLLELTADSNAHVRLVAAIFGFEADPDQCSKVLKSLLGEPGWVGIAALAWLVDKDPEFAAEFERNAQLEYENYKQEQARRFSGDQTEN